MIDYKSMIFTTMTKTYSLEKMVKLWYYVQMWIIIITHDCDCESLSNHLLNEKLGKTYF